MDTDPDVARFIPGPWADPDRHRAFVAARIAAWYPPGMGYWSIEATRQPGVFLGWILLMPVDTHGPEIEIGWRLIRAARGQGYATEAAAAVLRHAFGTIDFDEVIAEIHPDNLASLGVARKLGLSPAGPALRRAIRRMAPCRCGVMY